MLKIINPDGQKFHQSTIEAFLDLLKVYQNCELSSKRRKEATFFIAEDNEHGVYGGAVLYPQKISEGKGDIPLDRYDDTFYGAFATFRPQIQEFWISRICFCLEANLSPQGFKGMELSENFYRELHEAFLGFGQPKNLEFLAFSLYSFDTVDLPFYKKWRYMPIKLSDDRSGLTHGILSFKKTKFMPRVPRGSCLEKVIAQQFEAADKQIGRGT